MAIRKTKPIARDVDVEALLPWYAAGTLNAREVRCIDEALARDIELATALAAIREEAAEIHRVNESLGAPSPRVAQNLFSAIEAEPDRAPAAHRATSEGPSEILARVSSKVLAWSVGFIALILLLQAVIVGTMLMAYHGVAQPTAIQGLTATGPVALVRFAADTNAAQISDFLVRYGASVAEGTNHGIFRLQFARALTQQDLAALMNKLQNERIVSLSVVGR